MFGFLKDKLKGIVSKFSKKIDEEAKTVEEAPKEEPKPVIEEKKQIPKPEPKPASKAEEKKPEPKQEPKEKPKPEPKPAPRPEPKPESKPAPKLEPKAEEKKSEPKPVHVPKEEPKPEPKEEPKPVVEEEKPLSKPEPAPKLEKEETPEEEPVLMKMPEKERHGFFDFLKKHPKKEEEETQKEEPKVEEKKPEPKPIPKSVPGPEQKQEPKPEPEPEPKAEPKPVKETERVQPEPEPEKEEKKGIFSILKEKITKKELNEHQFEEMFWDLEMILLENNVAVEVIDKIKGDLKESLVDKPLERNKIDQIIESTLKRTIEDLFKVEGINLVKRAREKKPYIICFVGINGSGKTTSIAKVGHLLKKHSLTSVIAASDTFRAAAIQQLEEHANNLNIKLIKHDYGADSAAVAFDAISYAKAHNIDVVLIDTAGRLQSNTNLMDELKKVKRITKPDLILFVGESITGNDCVEQAKTFDSEIGIDGIILSKADIDEKGGAAISISYITRRPILYLGTGQGYDDLTEFNPKIILDSLGLEG